MAALMIVQVIVPSLPYTDSIVHAGPNGPILFSTNPADNATNVSPNAALQLQFDENVVKGTGSAAVTIRRVSDNAIVETFVVATSAAVTIGSDNRQVRITPSSNTLQLNTEYYVLIDPGAFRNTNGQNYAGISQATAWNFTVTATDRTPPVLLGRTPAQGGTIEMGGILQLQFDETVYASSGNVTLQRLSTNGAVIDTQLIGVTTTSVRGSGTSTITIAPSTPLEPSSRYNVSVSSGAFQDAYGNSYAGLNGWTFQTLGPPMSMPLLSPPDDATGVSAQTSLQMTFDLPVSKGTGMIVIKRVSNNSTVREYNVATSNLVTIDSIDPTIVRITNTDVTTNQAYYVLVDQGAFVSRSNPSIVFQGITDATQWNFSTFPSSDTIPPTVTALSPSVSHNSGTQTSLSFPLEMTFSEPVYPGNGQIVIRNQQNDAILTSIPVTSNRVTGGGTNKITITPGIQFVNNSSYYVQVGGQAFRDAAGNSYTGIPDTDRTTWRFSITQDTAPPLISALQPDNGATEVPRTGKFMVTFNEPIQLGTGRILIRAASGGNAPSVEPLAEIDPDNNRRLILTVLPNEPLSVNTAYYVEMQEGAVRDIAGNNFAGILNEYRWAFRTVGSDTTLPQLTKADMTGGTRIVLTYNKELNPNVVPAPANFYVTVSNTPRAVTSVAVQGTTVTLTLQSGVVFGQEVKVSYSKGASPIQDLSRNEAASLNGTVVGNTQQSTLPRPVSGTVSGALITITFNESLATMASSGAGQFTVYSGNSYRSVASVTTSGTLLLITLSSPITDGQAVSVNYSVGSSPLRDVSGNAVQAFSGFGVRNLLDTTPPVLQSIAAAGTRVILNYNEALNPGAVPPAGSFSVVVAGTGRTVNSVEISGTQAILTLSSAVASGQVVQVSYLGGNPQLADLAGNAAPPFANQMAGSVSGDNGQIIAATVQGQTLTLTFPYTLNPAYTPSATQFYARIQGVLHTVTSVSISGSSVVLQLHRSVATGETVSVTYSSTGTQLQSTGGVLIAPFTDYQVGNQSSWTGGGSLPSDFEVSDRGGLNMKMTVAITQSSMSPAGRIAQRYTIHADKVTAAYQAIRNGSGDRPRVQFTVPSSEMAAIVAVPVRQLEEVSRQTTNAVFAVLYKETTYEILLSALDFREIEQLVGTSGYLLIELEPNATSESNGLMSAISRANAQIMVSPMSFELSASSGGIDKPITNFTGYLTHTVRTAVQLDPRKTAAVWLDPETGALSYVPTMVTNTGGSSTITYKHKGNSAYAIVNGLQDYRDLANHWGRNDILMLVNKFVADGRTATSFDPNQPVTRGEFAVFIARGLGLSGDKSAASRYSDVNANSVLAAYIGAASKAGIVEGHPDGTFRPNQSITRQEMAAMMIRATAMAGASISIPQSSVAYLSRYKDAGTIAPWARDDMAKAVEAGIINGMTVDTISPRTDATRAQAAVMIKRMLGYIEFMDV
ncbi:Ig-like domain-containing protein [Paenibacillus daejeonensis]|uniref:Ig-like domain-containing protein n=1 Tax=Paenibacillus daejeonensis TaxID=135193 RepID=UPI0012FA29EB|nr:Ig-like domain-containing protein [Paenibacillus daejeonensis]